MLQFSSTNRGRSISLREFAQFREVSDMDEIDGQTNGGFGRLSPLASRPERRRRSSSWIHRRPARAVVLLCIPRISGRTAAQPAHHSLVPPAVLPIKRPMIRTCRHRSEPAAPTSVNAVYRKKTAPSRFHSEPPRSANQARRAPPSQSVRHYSVCMHQESY